MPRDGLIASVTLRLAPGEKERLREDARLAGLTVSELIRRQYFRRRIVARADLATIRELRRLGGLLKHIFAESGGSVKTDRALAAITAAIERIAIERIGGEK